jgi:broad specificity phosphatase PhoE
MPRSATLLIIRHAEKPADEDDDGLTPAGQARAQAYVAYFQTLELHSEKVATPAWLIAKGDEMESRRARLTLEPLAAALGLPLDTDLCEEQAREQAQRLLEDTRYDGATTLVCWSHKHLPELAKALGAPGSLLPNDWPDDVFDWLLRLDFDEEGVLVAAERHHQRLMFGDRDIKP